MRSLWFSALIVSLGLVATGSTRPASAADDAKIDGTWKLVLIPPLQEVDFLVLKVTSEGGKPAAEVKAAQKFFPSEPAIDRFSVKGDDVNFSMKLGDEENPFAGRLDKGGEVRGTLRLQGNTLPARLQKTEDLTLKLPEDRTLVNSYLKTRQEKDPKARAEKLTALLKEVGDSPKGDIVMADLLGLADEAGLTEAQVREHAEKWLAIARPYGDAYAADVPARIGKALAGKKAYAGVALEMLTAADKALGPDVPADTRVAVVRNLAEAARLAGKEDIAAAADKKAEGLDKVADEEYHKNVPPFTPTPFPGRKDKAADRVVLMELFTGAQCPPCVAADVAFDALIEAYKPTELITLQYHLHIPGPDPLTNADTVARAEYYPDLQGTPTVLFNGTTFPGGGGGMAASKAKFTAYSQAIDKLLEGKKDASISLKAGRAGDTLKITASATADGGKPDAKRVLRLALVEDVIRYQGGNKLRFHHHVVRSFPGGVKGVPLAGGKAESSRNVDLAALRKELDTYLTSYANEGGSFPSRPTIGLENLSVVAFVQDEGDKSVLHAVLVPVKASEPKP